MKRAEGTAFAPDSAENLITAKASGELKKTPPKTDGVSGQIKALGGYFLRKAKTSDAAIPRPARVKVEGSGTVKN